VDETRIITTEGLSTCLDPGRGWTITSGGWNFLEKQECWEGHEQALITTSRKESKRTEELKEAGYRSTTWAVLRALQQINSATSIEGEAARIEGGAAMSAPPFFQSAGRGVSGTRRSTLLGGGRRTNSSNMGEPIRTLKEKLAGGVEHDAQLGRVVQVGKKGQRKSAHLSSAGKKFSLSSMKRNRKRKRTKRTGAKRSHIAGRAYDTEHDGSKATSKWQSARITLHAGFSKISLSQQNKFRLC